ncbi:MAG: hypothetical protein V1773_19025 [bacterium]
MKDIRRIIILLFIFLGSISAQKFIGKINPYPSATPLTTKDNTNIKILAVMVEFLEDNDGATYGKGTFGSIYEKDYGNEIIDPLPHDLNYFNSHLTFAQNYYNKVSNGHVSVNYSLLPTVYKVTKKMREYSPLKDSDDYTLMGNFSKEVWEIVSAENPSLDFAEYNLFAIFHAGVGRDVNISGSLGNDKDLPSVYLSLQALKKIYGADFVGFPTNNAHVQNTMILPETESREITGITGSVLLELSINGLIVSSIASHLGLPDLFDTETGLSAIGRFGLMDGQAIFSYSGLFPPQPSAWEKIYLGWENPAILEQTGVYNVSIAASLASGLTNDKIYKIPINSTEYYLVENRQRDVNKDGAVLTINLNGQTITKVFEKDTTGFYSYAIDSLAGVVTDIDEYDWAIPGNGIVIWHIDENVINAKISTNSINTDKLKRGVDVEEADGIQDIGEQFTTIFGDQVVGEGDSVDMWYAGNRSKFYTNIFNSSSMPNTNSNSGANSLISLEGFSASGNVMTFRLTLGSTNITVLESFKSVVDGIGNITCVKNTFFALKDNALYSKNSTQNDFSFKYSDFSDNNLALEEQDGLIIGAFNTKLNVYSITLDAVYSFELNEKITTAPIIDYENNNYFVEVGSLSGKLFRILVTYTNSGVDFNSSTRAIGQYPVVQITEINGITGMLGQKQLNETSLILEGENNFKQFVYVRNDTKYAYYFALDMQNNFHIFDLNQYLHSFNVNTKDTIKSFSVCDLFHDGNYQIIFTDSNYVYAYLFSGAIVDGFPIKAKTGESFTNQILATDLDGNGYSEIIYFTTNGKIYAYTPNEQKMLSGFPISCGAEIKGYPVMYNVTENGLKKIVLNLLNKNNYFYSYKMDYNTANAAISYNGKFGNLFNNSFFSYVTNENIITEYFPDNRIYNWPNPVYQNSTNIRYYVSEDSKINIKIFDLAGGFVKELNTEAIGGLDGEIVWDVTNTQSGVYLARVEAIGNSGKSGNKIIKIAVIK